ncbi:FkbM family methyltransferase [Streptomyces sclerotialus]|uniref:FkbM family methyltransferase n=1 Tax=Streptomyces sclerotialus TaxID=1957 RepID=UPI000AC51492
MRAAGEAESTFEARAHPLPDVLTADEIAKARVIKIDVEGAEGAEGAAVRGLAPVLDQLRPDAEPAIEVTPQRMAELGHSAEELLETFTKRGFPMYRLANDYAAGSYPAALRRGAQAPVRRRGPVTDESELIFSRVDADVLL